MSHNSAVSLTLDAPRALHVVGIGGAGMSGIATVLHRMGHRVSGSDLKESPVVERLRAQGIDVAIGHAAEHLPSALDAVVVSTAIRPTNPEVVAAGDRGVPVLRRAEALRLITDTRRTLAVSGTHGKTTTSSLVTLVLREAGWHPSFLVGGELNEVGGNAFYDEGEWLVVEADESDGTFVELSAEAVVVTNVEPDHLDHYGGFDTLVEAFDQFVREADLAVVCADDAEALAIARRYDAVTYGFSPDADYVIGHYEAAGSGSRFVLSRGSETVGRVELSVPGRHNASNATAAAAVALELGAEFEPVASALRRFAGVARRFQFKGSVDGATVVDDYAHLPTEIRAALSAARDAGYERVVAVFQPHRYSRTEALWRDFAGAFDDADVVVLTDVFPAGEDPRPGVSGRLVLQAVLDAGPTPRVLYVPKRADVARYLRAFVRDGDVVLTLGAGDVNAVADDLVGGA